MNDRSDPDVVEAHGTDAVGLPAPRPYSSCPYRRDVPSGLWHADEYDKLREYDKEMPGQPMALFQCHQTDADSELRRLCAGWAACHGDNLLALRLALIENRISPDVFEATIDYRSPTPLFEFGTEAADHGQRDIDDPSTAAVHTMAKISRRRPGLL